MRKLLQGLLFFALLATGQAVESVRDTFTDTGGTVLSSHVGETGATWTAHPTSTGSAIITSAGRLRGSAGTSVTNIYYSSGIPTSADYTVVTRMYVASRDGSYVSPMFRCDPVNKSGYICGWNNSTNKFALYRLATGTLSGILATNSSAVSGSYAAGENYDVFITGVGNVITVKVQRVSDGQWLRVDNGFQSTEVVMLTYTDATPISAAGRAAVWIQPVAGATDSTSTQIDFLYSRDEVTPPTFEGADISATGTTATVYIAETGSVPVLPASGVTGFTLSTVGQPVTVTSAARTASNEITLNLSRTVYDYEKFYLNYSGGNVTDGSMNPLGAIVDGAIANGSDARTTPGTSEVVLIGTKIGDAGTSGHELAKAFDNDVNNYFEAAGGSPQFAGIDAGVSTVLRRVRLTPRGGDSTTDYEERMKGMKVQGSPDNSTWTDLYQVPLVEPGYFPRFDRTEVAIYSAGSSFRYYRVLQASGMNSFLAEVEFVVDAGPALSAPDRPRIGPWGGNFWNGNPTVTFSSYTAGTTFFYTLDGSTPATTAGGSTFLYSGPFSLAMGGVQKTLKVLAYNASLSTPASAVSTAYFRPWGFKPGEDRYDTDGNLIEAHAGYMIYAESRYWWYGDFTNKANHGSEAPPLTAKDTRGNKGVWCYSSPDSVNNWRKEGMILPNGGAIWSERPRVIYNSTTNFYIGWTRNAYHDTGLDRAMTAKSRRPGKGWHYVNTQYNPLGLGWNDATFFMRSNGVGYVCWTSGNQDKVTIAKLSADYLTVDATDYRTVITGNREAPVLFERKNRIFLPTTIGQYYGTATYVPKYLVQTGSPTDPWPDYSTSAADTFATDPVGTAYNGQSTFVIKIPGYDDAYMIAIDKWSPTALYDSKYTFLPITFPTDDTMRVLTPTEWNYDNTWTRSTNPAVFTGSFLIQ